MSTNTYPRQHIPYWSYMIEFNQRTNSVSLYGEDIGAAANSTVY